MEEITMFNIQLAVNCSLEKEKLLNWIHEEFQQNSSVDQPILIVEVRKLLDWVLIHRLKKQNPSLLICPLVNSDMLHTIPLTMHLELPYFFVRPLKKNFFIRTIKRAMVHGNRSSIKIKKGQMSIENRDLVNNEALQELYLRRLLQGDVKTEQEIINTGLFLTENSIPNTVCFIQGFVKDSELEKRCGWHAPKIIQEYFKEKFAVQVFFVHYRKHLLMLFRVPIGFSSPHFWKDGENIILSVIEELQQKYGIHLYIGVGSIYSDPLELHHSYLEARTARRTPPYHRLVLRYFDETAKEKQILRSIKYIGEHYADEITVTKVAEHINFSPTYFSRLFKKETGRSYVEYVTYVRLQRAIALIRHSDYTFEQIAEKLGFNTPNYFCSTFKKYAGLTPSEYKATKEILFY
jgi:two-component system, response regulator YesN